MITYVFVSEIMDRVGKRCLGTGQKLLVIISISKEEMAQIFLNVKTVTFSTYMLSWKRIIYLIHSTQSGNTP